MKYIVVHCYFDLNIYTIIVMINEKRKTLLCNFVYEIYKFDRYSMVSKITKSVFDMPIKLLVKISFRQYIRCNCTSVRDAW